MAEQSTIDEVSIVDTGGGVEEFLDERAISGLVTRGDRAVAVEGPGGVEEFLDGRAAQGLVNRGE